MDKFRVNFSQHSLIILSDFHVPDPDLPRHYYWLADRSCQTCRQCRRVYGSPVKGTARLPAQNQAGLLTGTIRPVLVAGRPIIHLSPAFIAMRNGIILQAIATRITEEMVHHLDFGPICLQRECHLDFMAFIEKGDPEIWSIFVNGELQAAYQALSDDSQNYVREEMRYLDTVFKIQVYREDQDSWLTLDSLTVSAAFRVLARLSRKNAHESYRVSPA